MKAIAQYLQKHEYSWVVKIRLIGGQYNSLGEYCGPHTASFVFLTLGFPVWSERDSFILVFKLFL